jgi:NAD(P)-dependent dehydrogenase (short-subunit alcohol dehydrogenase family)
MRRFDGRVALVTGGSSGIGRAVARRLASEGAHLCLLAAPDHEAQLAETADELRAVGAEVATLAADVGADETAEHAVELTLRELGRLDYVVDNAGFGTSEDVFDATIELFDHSMHVNVRGMYLVAIAAAQAMATADGGAIVCTASTASFMGEEQQVVYNTSKGAVAELARSLGVALAPYAIRVNAVAPGYVRTPATERGLADPVGWSRARSRIAADRPAEPHEIAAVIAFLLTEDASYMTGAVVVVDGGHTAGWRNTDWQAVTRAIDPRARRRFSLDR